MSTIDRLARALITAAARRWPAELAEEMAREWDAEVTALQRDGHAWRSLAFAGSLALSPAVEAADEEPLTWPDRVARWGHALAVPAALTLLAAALFNAAHLTQGRLGALAGGVVLTAVALVMVPLGRRTSLGRVVLLGASLYGFLLAGNQVAVMPFMGWIDIGPAVVAWTALMALTVRVSSGLRAAGRDALAVVAAIVGSLVALDTAAAAGSVHAAATLGMSALSAPLWFPLALLPGGVAGFGAYFPDGTAAFGSLQQAGPAFHASDILLGNASAMIGPLALCSVAVAAGLIRRTAPTGSPAPASRESRDTVGTIVLGVVTGLGGLAVGELLRRSSGAVDGTLHRLIDNSTVFGFGFLAHPMGRVAVALLIGLLVVRVGTPARRAAPM